MNWNGEGHCTILILMRYKECTLQTRGCGCIFFIPHQRVGFDLVEQCYGS